MTDWPGGGRAILAFTSSPEAVVRASGDQIAVMTTGEVLELMRECGLAGVVINPAGPWVALRAEELIG